MGARALAGRGARTVARRLVSIPPVGDIPPGRLMHLPGRGTTFVVDVPGPKGAPTLLLLHALACTAHLSWYPVMTELSQQYRLVTLDQRWHGRGIRSKQFRLEDCADDAVAVLDELYPPSWAASWDAVGLVCGDPSAEVRRVHFAVDPVEAVVDEALAVGADLLVTHHPLYLRGTSSVAATTPKGRVVHRLIAGGCGLLVAHTNADIARPGVNDALADAVELRDSRPLQPEPTDPLDKLVVFVPEEDADDLLDVLADAGAGAIGDYERCAWRTTGTGTFRPLEGASPATGQVGTVEEVAEQLAEWEALGVEELVLGAGPLPFAVTALDDVDLLATACRL